MPHSFLCRDFLDLIRKHLRFRDPQLASASASPLSRRKRLSSPAIATCSHAWRGTSSADCPTGEAVITPAFGIKTARHIIHAAGPVYSAYPPDKARALLRSAYRAATRLAVAQGCRSIAFPAISTSIYGYPLDEACRKAASVCGAEAAAHGLTIKLVAFDAQTAAELRKHLPSAGR